jgi:integrase
MAEAKAKLQQKEGDIARGLPLTNKTSRILVNELLDDLKDEYRTNGRKTIGDLEGRCKNHIGPFFGRMRASSLTTANVRAFILIRQKAGASNAEINRELAALKRAYSLALIGGKLLHKPYIPMVEENNVRQGFFERDQFEAVRRHLPESIQPVITFAYLTGWRNYSEVLNLQWHQVDMGEGVVRLNPGETKNDDGREFPFGIIDELRQLFEARRSTTDELQRRHGSIIPWVFYRETQGGVAPIRDFRKAWQKACIAAGVPGKLVHDFRRSAVRNLEKAGVPRSTATKLTGHKTESVYLRYAIVSKKELQEGAAKLQALHAMVTKTVTVDQPTNQLSKTQAP